MRATRSRAVDVVCLLAGAVILSGCGLPFLGEDQTARVEQGAGLYAEHCQQCHGGGVGGSVREVPPPHNANGHTWHHQDCLLHQIVRDGFSATDEPPERPIMPAFRGRLTDEDISAILAYVKTWWTDEQRDWQAQVTRQTCSGSAGLMSSTAAGKDPIQIQVEG